MALTALQLLETFARMQGTSFALWNEGQIEVAVGLLNQALKREWKTEDPLFAFPETVDAATVDVTDGMIDPDDLGDGTWCSLWESDPRAAGASRVPVSAHVSHEGVHPDAAYTSVFAFFRKEAPQIEYEVDSEYEDPDDIPEILEDSVPVRALAAMYVGLQQWEALKALLGLYGEPGKLREARVMALRNSGLVWDGYAMAITPAAAVAVGP